MQYKKIPGGIHPNGNKSLSNGKSVVRLQPTGDMVYFLGQHIGKPAAPVVKKGDAVLVGQTLAKADGFVSSPVICSCSGTVKAVDARLNPMGVMTPCIVVANDGQFNKVEGFGTPCDYTKLSNKEILDKVAAAGIVGLGGAGFPTQVKLMPRNPEAIDTVIANGSECEPYITCDDMLMREKADQVVEGLKIVLQLFPKAKGFIGVEKNKPEAIASLRKAAEGCDRITVAPLKTKYPEGGERSLIYAITGRKLAAGKLPADVGCMVDNVASLAAIYRAVACNEPLVEKYFTVSGDGVKEPGNFCVPIGTSIEELLQAAGGLTEDVKKVILGGPMMGNAITNLSAPIVKANNALTCMTVDQEEEARKQMTNCIRCGRCIQVCPVGLVPQMMAVAANSKDYARYESIHGLECIACGCCTYTCPAKRPLMQLFKLTKADIMAQKAKGAKK